MTDEERVLLAELDGHPAWTVFKRAAQELEAEFARTTTQAFLQKNTKPDYEKLQYDRGVLDGIDFVIKRTGREAAKFRSLEATEGSD